MAVPESMTVFDISGRYTMVRLLIVVGDLWSLFVLFALYVTIRGGNPFRWTPTPTLISC